MGWVLNKLRKVRKERANRSAFGALIAAPVVGSFALPANAARLGLRAVDAVVAGTQAAEIDGPTSRTISTPSMDAGTILVIEGLERGTVVTAEAGFEIVLDIGLNVWAKIGEGE